MDVNQAFQNGYIRENGVSRPLTASEQTELDRYQQAYSDFKNEVRSMKKPLPGLRPLVDQGWQCPLVLGLGPDHRPGRRQNDAHSDV